MLKYVDTLVSFQEVPDEISLCINFSNCPIKCRGCHSKHLWHDVGEELNLNELISKNKGITCICFMGGDSDIESVLTYTRYVKEYYPDLKVCWYSGNDLPTVISKIGLAFSILDFIKVGKYISNLGGLDKITTNQRFYKVNGCDDQLYLTDMTYKFRIKI